MSTTLAPLLSRKLKKVLETRTDSPELLVSLSTLSTFYTSNSQKARRNLKSTIERRGLEINEDFLAASEEAQQALDSVEAQVQGLAECCDRIAAALEGSVSLTSTMVSQTERLKSELERTQRRQQVVHSFLNSYQLAPHEISALREEELDDPFFTALARVQQIHANCKVLLRTHHQRAGLELMDVMAVYQEGAYERLCRWVQSECRSLGDSDTPEVSPLLKTAARCLKERPVLFKYCAEEVANTRHIALFRRFIAALTRGGPGGMPRPMEVHAHDPLRYVGDMLAWLHQALASERELAMALLSTHDDENGQESGNTSRRFSMDAPSSPSSSSSPSAPSSSSSSSPSSEMGAVLDRVFEGVCRPFKVRVEQVLLGQPGVLLVYKLANLLAFYSHTISELLGKEAALSVTLVDVEEASRRCCLDRLKQRGDKLLRYPPLLAADLSPPAGVGEGVAVMLELVSSHESIMVGEGMGKPSFQPIMDALLQPLLQMCERAAEAYGAKANAGGAEGRSVGGVAEGEVAARGRSGWGGEGVGQTNPATVQSLRNIFLINCLAAIQQALQDRPVAAPTVIKLGEALEMYITGLVAGEVGSLLDQCGLRAKLVVMTRLANERGKAGKGKKVEGNFKVKEIEEEGEEKVEEEKEEEEREEEVKDVPFSEVPGLDAAAVAESLKAFFALLSKNGGLSPELELVQAPRLRGDASGRMNRALVDAYKQVYNAVIDPANQYPQPRAMLRYAPDQLQTILGV